MGMCAICKKDIANLSRHLRNVHKLHRKLKGLQEWCPRCKKWGSLNQRSRHIRTNNIHPREEVVTKEDAIVMDPVTKTQVLYEDRGKWVKRQSQQSIPPPDELFNTIEDDSDESDTTQSSDIAFQEQEEIATPSNNDHCAAYERFVSDTLINAKSMISEMIKELNGMLEKTTGPKLRKQDKIRLPNKNRDARMVWEFPTYASMWDNIQEARAISATEYQELWQADRLGITDNRYVYVVCKNHAEAENVHRLGLPKRMVVVLPDAMHKPQLSVSRFTELIRSKKSVDVVEFRQPRVLPVAMEGEKVAEMMENPDSWINLLNLQSQRDNAYPPFIQNVFGYDILQRLTDSAEAGKQRYHMPRDLTNCSTFHVYSQRLVYSPPHRDHMGMLTTIFVEKNGLKGWLVWPQLTEEETSVWASKPPGSCPDVRPFFIALGEGYSLSQPPLFVHAPITLSDHCLLSGTQHLHSASMHIHMKAANEDLDRQTITNEDPTFEAYTKMSLIRTEMMKQNPAWPWPETPEIVIFEHEFNRYRERISCQCKNGCKDPDKCQCLAYAVKCSSRCHAQITKQKSRTRNKQTCANKESSLNSNEPGNSEDQGDLDTADTVVGSEDMEFQMEDGT